MGVSLSMFVLWEAAVLGSPGVRDAGDTPLLEVIQAASPTAGPLIDAFSFLAVATSFIAFVYSLTVSGADWPGELACFL